MAYTRPFTVVVVLLLCAGCLAGDIERVNHPPVSLQKWRSSIPPPVPQSPPQEDWTNLTAIEKDDLMQTCLEGQAIDFSRHALSYKSPKLSDVTEAVNKVLTDRNLTVTVVVFYGRGRYVSLLWQYLERNLRVNHGIVDKILMVTNYRNVKEGNELEAPRMLEAMKKKYPDAVEGQPFCPIPYGCAFDKMMVDEKTVYLKIDDDIIFVKDGSFEHMVYQQLTNKDYAFFSASIVNNPHGTPVHGFAGALQSEHFFHNETKYSPVYPFVKPGSAYYHYYGKNVYPYMGSIAHESFIHNAAHGRLDAYTYDVWNMHQCRCGKPQEGLGMCSEGRYRWSINGFVFTRNVSKMALPRLVPSFDEPFVSMIWPKEAAPHRVGIVGESLFVHALYTRQRHNQPDFGVLDELLLPWYHIFTKQYLASPYGEWKGNKTLVDVHERILYLEGRNYRDKAVHPKRYEGSLMAAIGDVRNSSQSKLDVQE